jgi:hypothetical protein
MNKIEHFRQHLIENLSISINTPIEDLITPYFKTIDVIKYDTPIMTKNKQLVFKTFIDFGDMKQSPELCMFAVNQYFYSFHNLTSEEFITIIKWEIKHENL